MDNLAGLMVSPEYTCQVELSYCARAWYTHNTVEAYADRVLKYKPEFLQKDNYLNFLYG